MIDTICANREKREKTAGEKRITRKNYGLLKNTEQPNIQSLHLKIELLSDKFCCHREFTKNFFFSRILTTPTRM